MEIDPGRPARSGNEHVMSPPEEFTGFVRAEVVREANIRIE